MAPQDLGHYWEMMLRLSGEDTLCPATQALVELGFTEIRFDGLYGGAWIPLSDVFFDTQGGGPYRHSEL